MDDIERDRKILAKYPLYILLLVKAAKKALDDGRAYIKDGMLTFKKDEPLPGADLRAPQGKEPEKQKSSSDPTTDQK